MARFWFNRYFNKLFKIETFSESISTKIKKYGILSDTQIDSSPNLSTYLIKLVLGFMVNLV